MRKERIGDMSQISLENVTSRFCELTHLDSTEAANYSAAVSAAAAYFTKLLLREPSEEEVSGCEYAVACKAFYDYTVIRAATEKTYSTSTGGIFSRASDQKTSESAHELYKQALASLPDGLVSDGGFAFAGVRG